MLTKLQTPQSDLGLHWALFSKVSMSEKQGNYGTFQLTSCNLKEIASYIISLKDIKIKQVFQTSKTKQTY